MDSTRRRLLRALAGTAAVGGLAGCSSGGTGDATTTDGTAGGTTTADSATTTATTDGATVTAEAEAEVTAELGEDTTTTTETTTAATTDDGESTPAGRSEPPLTTFSFTYTPESSGSTTGTLVITHESGDPIPQRELYVRGSGFATSVTGVDQTSAGQWAGTTTDGEVLTGDSVRVGVTNSYDITVEWESSVNNRTTVLGADQGPNA